MTGSDLQVWWTKETTPILKENLVYDTLKGSGETVITTESVDSGTIACMGVYMQIEGKVIEEVKEGTKSLHQAASDLREVGLPLLEDAKGFVDKLRGPRMAMVMEVSQMTHALADLRKFFLGPEYDTEIKKLEQFVGLCERLKALKSDGTLDAVSETIIRLMDPVRK